MSKRALSLDDLVNHDESDKQKLQKISTEVENEQDGKTFNDDISPTEDNQDDRHPGVSAAVAPSSSSVNAGSDAVHDSSVNMNDFDDETDTDDEFGEVNFDNGMTFDYDKQDKDSPQKKQAERNTKLSVTNEIAKPKLEAEPQMKIKPEGEKEVEEPPKVSVGTTESTSDTLQKKNSVDNIFQEKSSLQSKRNNVKKDLQVLNEISSNSKPNKYSNVPMWARKWKPTINALQNMDTNDFKVDPSILNIIPDDDLTKSVQDWVYATVYSIPADLRQFIEMEMKFGLIIDAKGPDRITPPISSQAIYTELDAHLTPNVDETLFKELNKYIRGVSELNENSGKFSVIESLSKDSVYRVGLTTQRPKFLRMSTDIKTGRVGQFIEKRHVAQLLLFSPKDSYDAKISINLELPVPENDPPEKYQSQTPISERTKDRVSYIHNDSCTRIDVTKVQNHNQGVKGRHIEVTHEIEIEINTPALLKSFDHITSDSKEYASVIRTFLNNGTLIRRKLTSLSYDIFEGQKK